MVISSANHVDVCVSILAAIGPPKSRMPLVSATDQFEREPVPEDGATRESESGNTSDPFSHLTARMVTAATHSPVADGGGWRRARPSSPARLGDGEADLARFLTAAGMHDDSCTVERWKP